MKRYKNYRINGCCEFRSGRRPCPSHAIALTTSTAGFTGFIKYSSAELALASSANCAVLAETKRRMGPLLAWRRPFNRFERSLFEICISTSIKDGAIRRAVCRASRAFVSERTMQFLWLKSVSHIATVLT